MPQISLKALKEHPFVRRLAINTASMTLVQGARVIINVILSLLVANQFGAAGLGKYAILTAFVLLFQQIVNAGIPRLIVREVARHQEDTTRWFSRSVFNQLFAGLLGMALYWIVIGFLSYDDDLLQALQVSALCLIPYAFGSTVDSFLQAGEKMHLINLTQLSGRFVQLIGSAVLLAFGYDIVALAWMIVLGQIVTAIVALILSISLRYFRGIRLEWKASLLLFKQAFDFNLLQLSIIVYSKLDILILSLFVDEVLVGIYNAAWLVIQAITVLATGYSAAIYPILSRYYTESIALFKRSLGTFLRIGVLASFFVALIVFLLAGPIIAIPFRDPGYVDSSPILRILSPFIIIFTINAIMANGLFASNQQRLSVIVAGVKLVIGFFLYWILIQQLGIIGAAVATVLAGLVGSALNGYFLHRSLRRELIHE
jgi:O-antigen/teichoic acid export membrane protein